MDHTARGVRAEAHDGARVPPAMPTTEASGGFSRPHPARPPITWSRFSSSVARSRDPGGHPFHPRRQNGHGIWVPHPQSLRRARASGTNGAGPFDFNVGCSATIRTRRRIASFTGFPGNSCSASTTCSRCLSLRSPCLKDRSRCLIRRRRECAAIEPPFVRPAGGAVERSGRPSSRPLPLAAARRSGQGMKPACGARPGARPLTASSTVALTDGGHFDRRI